MEIALVHCPAWITDCPPYASASLAANLRGAGYKVRCYDLNIEFFRLTEADAGKTKINSESWDECNIRDWENPKHVREYTMTHSDVIDRYIDDILSAPVKIVGFTTYYISAYFSYEVARRIKNRNPGIIIVFGGPYCFKNAVEIEVLNDCPAVDMICYGEAEEAIVKLADCINENKDYTRLDGFAFRLTDGTLDKGRDMPRIMDFENLPFADFSDFNLELYTRKLLPMNSCRGCVNRCAFCNESPYWGKFRGRSAKRVFEEISYQLEKYPFIENIWFTDSLINGNMKMMSEMCDYFISMSRKFLWDASALIRKEMTDEILVKMKASGCNSLHYGLESGSNHVLKLMNKGYSRELAITILMRTLNADINVNVNLIVGFPGETVMDFMETVDLIRVMKKAEKFNYQPPVNTCMIVKGSDIYVNPLKYDVVFNEPEKWITRDWSNTPAIRKNRKDLLLKFIQKYVEKNRTAKFLNCKALILIFFTAYIKQIYYQYFDVFFRRILFRMLTEFEVIQKIGLLTIIFYGLGKKWISIGSMYMESHFNRKIKKLVNKSDNFSAQEKSHRCELYIKKAKRIASMLPEEFKPYHLYSFLLIMIDEKHIISDLEAYSDEELLARAIPMLRKFFAGKKG